MKFPATGISKQKSVDPGFAISHSTNPFDKDEPKNALNTSQRTSSEPMLVPPEFEDDLKKERYKNGFRDSGGLENQSVQELESYTAYKAEETTKCVNDCLRIAEDIRQDATRTLEMLNNQGEQITRTHFMAVNIDKDLSRGEKLLNNLGGMFSKTWKPKKTREINGSLTTPDTVPRRNEKSMEERQKLGLVPVPKGRSANRTPNPEPNCLMQKVQVEREKQDDAFSDLSNIVCDLKSMALDMGNELDRQNKAMDHLSDDVDELNSRVKGANQRTRRLLGK